MKLRNHYQYFKYGTVYKMLSYYFTIVYRNYTIIGVPKDFTKILFNYLFIINLYYILYLGHYTNMLCYYFTIVYRNLYLNYSLYCHRVSQLNYLFLLSLKKSGTVAKILSLVCAGARTHTYMRIIKFDCPTFLYSYKLLFIIYLSRDTYGTLTKKFCLFFL